MGPLAQARPSQSKPLGGCSDGKCWCLTVMRYGEAPGECVIDLTCQPQLCVSQHYSESNTYANKDKQGHLLSVFFQGIDVKSMGRIFVGLVKCGAWGCFDEFNRLEEAVLSAVSMQIQAIQDSLKHHKNTCDLLGKEVRK